MYLAGGLGYGSGSVESDQKMSNTAVVRDVLSTRTFLDDRHVEVIIIIVRIRRIGSPRGLRDAFCRARTGIVNTPQVFKVLEAFRVAVAFLHGLPSTSMRVRAS